jgi:hypothetical protein
MQSQESPQRLHMASCVCYAQTRTAPSKCSRSLLVYGQYGVLQTAKCCTAAALRRRKGRMLMEWSGMSVSGNGVVDKWREGRREGGREEGRPWKGGREVGKERYSLYSEVRERERETESREREREREQVGREMLRKRVPTPTQAPSRDLAYGHSGLDFRSLWSHFDFETIRHGVVLIPMTRLDSQAESPQSRSMCWCVAYNCPVVRRSD